MVIKVDLGERYLASIFGGDGSILQVTLASNCHDCTWWMHSTALLSPSSIAQHLPIAMQC